MFADRAACHRQPLHYSNRPKRGDGCRMFGIVSSSNVAFYDLHMEQGGWFTGLLTNITRLVIDGVTVIAARDCFDIVSSRHVLVQNVHISGGGDDAVVLKSDVSTGEVIPSYNITVRDSVIGSNGCNALQFGSETAGACVALACFNTF